jgi:hypothetical protein
VNETEPHSHWDIHHHQSTVTPPQHCSWGESDIRGHSLHGLWHTSFYVHVCAYTSGLLG